MLFILWTVWCARWAWLVSVELLFYMHCERDRGFNSGRDANTPADLSMEIKAADDRDLCGKAAKSLPRHLSPTVNKLYQRGKLYIPEL
jgi:hypothetical protein